MEDTKIVELFFARDEKALSETQSKYGPFCRNIAWNLLLNREDAEECVNDTMHAAWNTIPPTRPHSLRAYLGGITRKLALMCFRKRTAKKRDGGIALSLEELSEVIPSAQDVERSVETSELSEYINKWLRTLDPKQRVLFVRRYWFGDPVLDLAKKAGLSPNTLSQQLFVPRRKLKEYLEQEGVSL